MLGPLPRTVAGESEMLKTPAAEVRAEGSPQSSASLAFRSTKTEHELHSHGKETFGRS